MHLSVHHDESDVRRHRRPDLLEPLLQPARQKHVVERAAQAEVVGDAPIDEVDVASLRVEVARVHRGDPMAAQRRRLAIGQRPVSTHSGILKPQVPA
jgi:hypothetical protein